MALPMGELSAKLTERALLSPLRGHLSQRERQGRSHRLSDKFHFVSVLTKTDNLKPLLSDKSGFLRTQKQQIPGQSKETLP